VVDNGSSDGSADVAEALGASVIRNRENWGYSRAANAGLEHVGDANYVIFLNPDTIPQAGALSRLIDVLEEDSEIAIASGFVTKADGSPRRVIHRHFHTFGWTTAQLFGVGRIGFGRRPDLKPRPDTLTDVRWAGGACLALRRSVASALGGYDERFFLYAEDADLCLRAHQFGRVVVVGDAPVIHIGGVSASHGGAVVASARMAAAHVSFIAKHSGRVLALFYAALAVLRYVPNVLWERAARRPSLHGARVRAIVTQSLREWKSGN
jgi:hypothetical protein